MDEIEEDDMKRYLTLICCVMMMAAGTCAFADTITTASDQEYKDMAELKKKFVRMKKEMDSFMKEIVSTYSDTTDMPLGAVAQDIKVDIAENDKEYTVRADMPGMSKDRIDVTLENERFLRISGTRETVIKEESPGMVRQERSLGKVERMIELPGAGTVDGIKAEYKDGVLQITIPKRKPDAEKKVKVKVQ